MHIVAIFTIRIQLSRNHYYEISINMRADTGIMVKFIIASDGDLAMELKLQKQVISNGCMSACVAMVCELDVNVVTEQLHEDYVNHVTTPEQYARKLGVILSEPFPGAQRDCIKSGYVYILIVPSLNTWGMLHAVVLDARDPENIKCYDPANGQQYLAPGQYEGEPGTTQLTTWVVKYIVEKSDETNCH